MSIIQFAKQELDFELSHTQRVVLKHLYGEKMGARKEWVCVGFDGDGHPRHTKMTEEEVLSHLESFPGSRIRPRSEAIICMGRRSAKSTLARLICNYETQRVSSSVWGAAPKPVRLITPSLSRTDSRGLSSSLTILDELSLHDNPWESWMTWKTSGDAGKMLALTSSGSEIFAKLATSLNCTVLQVPTWMANPNTVSDIVSYISRHERESPSFRVEYGGLLR